MTLTNLTYEQQQAFYDLTAERDSLAARVEELEAALRGDLRGSYYIAGYERAQNDA